MTANEDQVFADATRSAGEPIIELEHVEEYEDAHSGQD